MIGISEPVEVKFVGFVCEGCGNKARDDSVNMCLIQGEGLDEGDEDESEV